MVRWHRWSGRWPQDVHQEDEDMPLLQTQSVLKQTEKANWKFSSTLIYPMSRRECTRCHAHIANGPRRCSRRTCIYPRYCWQHTQKLDGLKLAPSTLPNTGLGLFATKDFARNELIGPYTGTISTVPINGPYVLEVHRRKFIDAKSTQSCITRYANDCRTVNKRAGQCRGNNSQFRPTRDRQGANLKADRLIRAGQEIFVGYSRDYWR